MRHAARYDELGGQGELESLQVAGMGIDVGVLHAGEVVAAANVVLFAVAFETDAVLVAAAAVRCFCCGGGCCC